MLCTPPTAISMKVLSPSFVKCDVSNSSPIDENHTPFPCIFICSKSKNSCLAIALGPLFSIGSQSGSIWVAVVPNGRKSRDQVHFANTKLPPSNVQWPSSLPMCLVSQPKRLNSRSKLFLISRIRLLVFESVSCGRRISSTTSIAGYIATRIIRTFVRSAPG